MPWEFAMAICRGNLPQLFAVAFCRRNLSQLFAVAFCRGNLPPLIAVRICRSFLPWQFAVAICHKNLPWVCFVYVRKPFFCVSKSFFFVSRSFLCESKPFYMWTKLFLFIRISLLTVFLFVFAVAVMGHRKLWYINDLTNLQSCIRCNTSKTFLQVKSVTRYRNCKVLRGKVICRRRVSYNV